MKKYLIFLLLHLYAICCYAQTLKGKVVDAGTNEPLANVNISIMPGNKTLNSDKGGLFALALGPGKYILTVKRMGYHAQNVNLSVPYNGLLNLSLLAKATELDEVTVNTGYQKVARERATGSFSLVDHQTFNQQIGTDVISRLEGITPALSVDRRTASTPILMVRGLSTIRGDRTPLIILDDFPYSGDLANINPNDVESITILKDAAAASIWGAKGGNGVIVITTKKGRSNQPLQIDFSASTSLSAKSGLNEYNNLNSADEIAVEKFLFGKGYYASQETSAAKLPLSPVVELLIANRSGKLGNADLDLQLGALGSQDIRQNYAAAFLDNGLQQQYSLGLRGGSDKMNWYVFTGYDHNNSELNAKFDRLNLRIDNNIVLAKKLDLGVSLYLTKTEDWSGRSKLSAMTTTNGFLPPYTQFADGEGNALPVIKNYRTSYTNTLAGGNLLDWNYYPLTEGTLTQSKVSKTDLLANLSLSYAIVKGLKAVLKYQYERQQLGSRTVDSPESFYVRNLVNLYTQVNGTALSQPIPNNSIYGDGAETLIAGNARGQISYEGRVGKISINALAGGELRSSKTESSNTLNYGVDSEILKTVAVDYVNPYKNIITGSNIYIPYRNDYTGLANRYVSAYGNFAANYLGKYTVSASARRDASNVFGVATNDLWNPLWSVGGAWLLSEEQFLKTLYLPYARLRLTYGSSGNSDGKRAAVTTIVYNGTSPYTRTPYANFSNYANPDLRWETVKTLNIGADLKWFNDRLVVSADYYVKKSYDLIENTPIDYTGGIGPQAYKNTAKISVRGLDLEISTVNLKGKLAWTTSLFGNFYRDRTDAYYRSSQATSTFVTGSTIVSGVVGKPVYSIYAYKWAGLNPANGNPQGYLNGNVSEDYSTMIGAKATVDDLKFVGPTFPTFTGAVGNSFKWSGLSLDFRVSYKFGYYFRRSALSYGDLYSLRLGHSEYADRWQKPGDELATNVPSAVYPAIGARDNFYNLSEATIISGDHVRLQYIGLGYSFTKAALKQLPFKQLSIRAVANNLGLLWMRNHNSVDPDYPGAVPPKTYAVNLQLTL